MVKISCCQRVVGVIGYHQVGEEWNAVQSHLEMLLKSMVKVWNWTFYLKPYFDVQKS